MKFKNVHGFAYGLMPKVLVNPNVANNTILTNASSSGNKVMFFSGSIPTPDVCLELTSTNIAEITGSALLCETATFDVLFNYDVTTKKKIIKKKFVDALEMRYLEAGTIGFAAIILTGIETTNEYIIFTDSIGTWGEANKPVIVDNKNGSLDSLNIFKNLSIEISDKSDNASF